MAGTWTWIADLLLIFAVILAFSLAALRLRLTPAMGALLAGLAVGPSALGLVEDPAAVLSLAELGVALLLFTVGLEFSVRRLRSLGMAVLGGGVGQVTVTAIVAGAAAAAAGMATGVAVAVGCVVALSSTAAVVRSLEDRSELDSPHGRAALGVLLVQDLALVPLLLAVESVAEGGGAVAVAVGLGRSLAVVTVLVGALYAVASLVLPRLAGRIGGAGGRDVGVIFALVVALGSAWLSHALGLSPALGAFVAGMLLAESPFALQLRVDLSALKSLFMALFFASIGMLADLPWMGRHLPLVLGATALVVIGKALVAGGVLRALGVAGAHAAAAGLCLGQIGEFSFVIGDTARQLGLLGPEAFSLLVAVLITGFALTPALVAAARPLAGWLVRGRGVGAGLDAAPGGEVDISGHALVVGYGPAGESAARAAGEAGLPVVVIELNGTLAGRATGHGWTAVQGDGAAAEVLHHAGAERAAVAFVTVPDPRTAERVVRVLRCEAPAVPVIARSRYGRYSRDLEAAGAHVVVDEEQEVGLLVAARMGDVLSAETVAAERR